MPRGSFPGDAARSLAGWAACSLPALFLPVSSWRSAAASSFLFCWEGWGRVQCRSPCHLLPHVSQVPRLTSLLYSRRGFPFVHLPFFSQRPPSFSAFSSLWLLSSATASSFISSPPISHSSSKGLWKTSRNHWPFPIALLASFFFKSDFCKDKFIFTMQLAPSSL